MNVLWFVSWSKRIISVYPSVTSKSAQSFATIRSSPGKRRSWLTFAQMNIGRWCVAGTVRVECVHCGQEFLFNVIQKSLAKCPHCRKISAIGVDYRRRQLRLYSIVGALFTLITTFVIVGTVLLISETSLIIPLYLAFILITVLAFVRLIYIYRMKASRVDGPAWTRLQNSSLQISPFWFDVRIESTTITWRGWAMGQWPKLRCRVLEYGLVVFGRLYALRTRHFCLRYCVGSL